MVLLLYEAISVDSYCRVGISKVKVRQHWRQIKVYVLSGKLLAASLSSYYSNPASRTYEARFFCRVASCTAASLSIPWMAAHVSFARIKRVRMSE